MVAATVATRDWKSTFTAWSKPPSETEEAKAENAARMIREAVRVHPILKTKNIDVYATGSYRNNTNTKAESDIDVAVVLRSAIYTELPADGSLTKEQLGLTGNVSYGLTEVRSDVHAALVEKFGKTGVTPGDKAFNIHENTYRLDADVAVFLEHRRYTGQKGSDGNWRYHSGVEMRSQKDPNKRIINWHEQHYENGVKRNAETSRRYKRITRILKRLRDDMKEAGDGKAQEVARATPSFLLECLAFNAKLECFNCAPDHYCDDVESVLASQWRATRDDAGCDKWVEVSGLKWLWGTAQPWTRQGANDFLLAAWQHVGFK